ncbi:facilitated trehalose transporter Tret1-like [Homalodisca vitripennis]|uniref:facilitated trehalose transporter Tret1-like n=1 Tax=Homalodisca vitripennis TaxID=197043 RepID=UPI001EEAE02D|nr:facilitated trehalose transporter Tret1-like [Homalodisca vitripennis]
MSIHENKDNTDNFRSTLAQVVATLALSCLSFSIGFVAVMPTIVIGALRNDTSPLGMSETAASWFGSVMFVMQPMGSGVSAFLQDILGRKTCLMAVNIPNLIAWTIIYFSTSTVHLFMAVIIIGIAMGFLEAPILSYVGEITQPRLRGILTSFSGVFSTIGMMILSSLATVMDWRNLALISMSGPVMALVALAFVPDSPAWLVSKGRVSDAEKAFQWLRGWVRPEDVKHELAAIVNYVKETQSLKIIDNIEYKAVPNKENPVTTNPQGRLQLLMEPRVRKAFQIVFIYFTIMACAALLAMRPYFIEILKDIGSPIRPHIALALCNALQLVGAICGGVLMRILGKRRLSFLSLGLSVFCCLTLGLYLSYRPEFPWIPVALFCLSYFAGPLGIFVIPWILIMELFPLRARGMAGGICGAVAHGLFFTTTKTYYSLVHLVDISGACYFYGAVGVLGLIYLYWDLPETEGVSLEEIERKFGERRNSKQYRSP